MFVINSVYIVLKYYLQLTQILHVFYFVFSYKRQKLNENKVTSAQVKAALNKIEDSEVEGIHLTMKGTCEISVHLNHLPVFVGGR